MTGRLKQKLVSLAVLIYGSEQRESSFLFPPLFSWEESQSSCFEFREAGFLYRGLFSKVTLIFN